jgi:hypothetical protein
VPWARQNEQAQDALAYRPAALSAVSGRAGYRNDNHLGVPCGKSRYFLIQSPVAPAVSCARTAKPSVQTSFFLCIKPRGQLSQQEAAKVDWLKPVSPVFATMRQLAMRFRGLLRGRDSSKLDAWLDDACATGLHSIQRLTHYLRHDIEAVCNAISESWSNGQTEGQINRPKTLKCAMYERAGTELLRARMLPLRG